jgi:hypothetical protein
LGTLSPTTILVRLTVRLSNAFTFIFVSFLCGGRPGRLSCSLTGKDADRNSTAVWLPRVTEVGGGKISGEMSEEHGRVSFPRV